MILFEYMVFGLIASCVLIFIAKIVLYGILHREEGYYEEFYEKLDKKPLSGFAVETPEPEPAVTRNSDMIRIRSLKYPEALDNLKPSANAMGFIKAMGTVTSSTRPDSDADADIRDLSNIPGIDVDEIPEPVEDEGGGFNE